MVVEKSMARAQGRQVAAEINKCKCEKNVQVGLCVATVPILVHNFTPTSITLFDTVRWFLDGS